MNKIIDSHIHLDKYLDEEIDKILTDVDMLVSVSTDLESCKRNLALSKRHLKVQPAFGFHPEQSIPSEESLNQLFSWIEKNHQEAIAIGEIGLPYYLRRSHKLTQTYDQYIEVLDAFICSAMKLNKPVALHAVYDDAHIVCDLLEKHTVRKAHFHWFKGDQEIVERLRENGYFISVTPDVFYEEVIQKIVHQYPLELIMSETDGPWPFKGRFQGKRTRPSMIHHTMEEISRIKRIAKEEVYQQLHCHASDFYVVKKVKS